MRACSILTVLVCKQLYIHKDFSLGAEERGAEHEGWCGISDVKITNEHNCSVMDMEGGRARERHSQHVYGSTRLDRVSSVCKQMWYLSKSAALARAVCHSGRSAEGIIFKVRQALKGRHTETMMPGFIALDLHNSLHTENIYPLTIILYTRLHVSWTLTLICRSRLLMAF